MRIQTKFFDILQQLLHITTVIINAKMTFQIDTDLKAISASNITYISALGEPMRCWYDSNRMKHLFENSSLI